MVVAYNECGARIGETHHNATISNDMVDLIHELHEDFCCSYRAIAEELKLSMPTVRKICTYERRAQTAEAWKRLKCERAGRVRSDERDITEIVRNIRLYRTKVPGHGIRTCFHRDLGKSVTSKSDVFIEMQLGFGFAG